MENASKALLMAAGVLISLLVLSLGVYLFITFGQAAKETHQEVEIAQIEQFNSQYTSYLGRENLTVHDVVTVANLATRNNVYYELPRSDRNKNGKGTYYIAVNFKDDITKHSYPNEFKEKGIDNFSVTDMDKQNSDLISAHSEKVKTNNGKLPTVRCIDVKLSETTKRVYEIDFQYP